MRSRTPVPLMAAVLATLLLGLSGTASATETTLRWTHPNPSEVTGFTVHLGYAPNDYEAELTQTFAGLEAGPGDIYQVAIDIEPDRTIFLAVRAYNDSDTSVYSNAQTRYEATPLGVPGRPTLGN